MSRQKPPPPQVSSVQEEEARLTPQRLWEHLTAAHQQQMAHCLAGLIWRMRQPLLPGEEGRDEQP